MMKRMTQRFVTAALVMAPALVVIVEAAPRIRF
jgi:hypothetical protein